MGLGMGRQYSFASFTSFTYVDLIPQCLEIPALNELGVGMKWCNEARSRAVVYCDFRNTLKWQVSSRCQNPITHHSLSREDV